MTLDAETAGLAAKALLVAEWAEHGGPVYSCTGCNHSWTFRKVHSPECRVDAALTRLGYPDRASRDKALRKLRDDDFNERWRPKPAEPRPEPAPAAQPETARSVPDSPTSDPNFDSDPDDGGD